MSAAAILLLLPEVVLLPPDAGGMPAAAADACARGVATSPALTVARLEATAPSDGAPASARAELDQAARHFRELRLAEARPLAEGVVRAVAGVARSAADFELLLEARLRLAGMLLAQRRAREAATVLQEAARQAPDAQVTDLDWPPPLVAAFGEARARVGSGPRHRLAVAARASIEPIATRTWIDGRPVEGAEVELPAGEHVVVATAPGHEPQRRVVALPADTNVSLVLAPAGGRALRGLVLQPVLAPVPHGDAAGVRVSMRAGGREAGARTTALAGLPDVCRALAESAAGVVSAPPRATATGAATRRTPGPFDDAPPQRPARSRPLLAQWWFWTIAGSVVTVGVIGLLAASRGDPGTDVHVGTP